MISIRTLKTREKEFYRFFFWFVIGSCAILLPLIGIMTMTSLGWQERFTERLLLEKGEALIRSYEAGVRTVAARQLGPFERQKLVIELTREPGVDYIIITDSTGLVIADSEPFRIGGFYALDIKRDSLSTARPTSRRVKNRAGADTFEIFRATSDGLFIFIGLDMGPILEAHREDVKRTWLLSFILLMVGITAVIALLLTYRYRMTRSSLEELRLFSHYLLEHLPVGVISISREGKVALINDAARRLLNFYEEREGDAKKGLEFPAPIKDILSELVTTERIKAREVEWKEAGKSVITAEIIATKLQDGNTIILLRDLAEVKNLREEVERSRRLASIGTLAAGVAHEIRNPLSSIKGFATFFMEKYGLDPEAKEAGQIMITEIERLNRVIGQLLSLARPPAVKYEQVEMGHIIAQSIKTVAPEFAQKGVAIKNTVEGITCQCDPDQMQQVFINLLLNALSATKAGDKVVVEGKKLTEERISLTVFDTGRGIEPEDLPHVFDPFFTTKSSGTGLGLAIVHKIIEAHGGEVSISSTPGQGTEVKIIIPIEKKAA
ncbi:MAG: ATP-binding protein [Syntrophales bacterium]|nr:ATP-binding protein [Syntrophales bacterium]